MRLPRWCGPRRRSYPRTGRRSRQRAFEVRAGGGGAYARVFGQRHFFFTRVAQEEGGELISRERAHGLPRLNECYFAIDVPKVTHCSWCHRAHSQPPPCSPQSPRIIPRRQLLRETSHPDVLIPREHLVQANPVWMHPPRRRLGLEIHLHAVRGVLRVGRFQQQEDAPGNPCGGTSPNRRWFSLEGGRGLASKRELSAHGRRSKSTQSLGGENRGA